MDSELSAWLKPINAFVEYDTEAAAEINKYESKTYGAWRDWLTPHFVRLRDAVSHNGNLCRQIAQCAPKMLDTEALEHLAHEGAKPTQLDAEKVRSTLRQLAREWSADGAAERAASFSRIVDALLERFPNAQARVVVPGSGLGRLPFELARAGFHAIGNEFSVHMIYASDLILNNTVGADSLEVFPYIHNRSHIRSREDQVAKVSIPDVWPGELHGPGVLEMAIGDFHESFTDAEPVDAVATAFFLDTSDDIFATIATISKLVRPGGLWANFGPLLWHFEHDAERSGLELCMDDLLHAIRSNGWEFEHLESDIETTYCTSPNALGAFVYKCVFFVARRCG